MKTSTSSPVGKMRTRFKVALVIATISVWLSTLSYAKAAVEKQSGITFSVFFLLGVLAIVGALPRFAVFMRPFVFLDKGWNQEANQKSIAIVLYALVLLIGYFVWR